MPRRSKTASLSKQRRPRASSSLTRRHTASTHAPSLRCNSLVLQSCSLGRAHFFLLHLYLKRQSPSSLLNYVVQVQSARKSNCTGCLELPETDWKLRAELSGAPEGLARLCVCVCLICVCSCHAAARIISFHFACAELGHARPHCVSARAATLEGHASVRTCPGFCAAACLLTTASSPTRW